MLGELKRTTWLAATQWSLVQAIRQGDTRESQEALSRLYKLYWYPLYVLVRRMGRGPEEAQDLVQGFFTHLLEKKQLHRVDEERGKLCPWLLTLLKHYVANEREREHTLKRGGGYELLPMDMEAAESLYGVEREDDMSPERLYKRAWALALLRHTRAALRKEYEHGNKGPLFDRLQGLLTSEYELCPYQQVARELDMKVGAVKMAAHRLCDRYRGLLRTTIAHMLKHPEDVDDELRELLAAL
jgi:DNA-directed RNA polymerase specialized sigma24 family protein